MPYILNSGAQSSRLYVGGPASKLSQNLEVTPEGVLRLEEKQQLKGSANRYSSWLFLGGMPFGRCFDTTSKGEMIKESWICICLYHVPLAAFC